MPHAVATDASLPIFDFSIFLSGNESQRKNASRGIVQAFKTYGFTYLVNYGISDERVEALFDWSRKLFQLPESERTKPSVLFPTAVAGQDYYVRGYSPVGREKISQGVFDEEGIKAQRNVQDVKELFDMGPDRGPAATREPNRWPSKEAIPGFQEFAMSFFFEANELAQQILACLALGLDLPESFFIHFHEDADNLFRLIHYPAVERKAIRSGQKARIPPHTDFGTLTILFQDDVGGLEVEDPSTPGKYIAATPIPGSVIVNIGDFLMRWTNDILKSNLHHVVEPPAERGLPDGNELTRERYSIPYFVQADRKKVIQSLPQFAQGAPKYPDVSAQEYLNQRMLAINKEY
ncbi:2-oxoglutarate-dependent dioxygenase frbA [Exophiala dermatitidis]